jgi:hypothetical protein
MMVDALAVGDVRRQPWRRATVPPPRTDASPPPARPGRLMRGRGLGFFRLGFFRLGLF